MAKKSSHPKTTSTRINRSQDSASSRKSSKKVKNSKPTKEKISKSTGSGDEAARRTKPGSKRSNVSHHPKPVVQAPAASKRWARKVYDILLKTYPEAQCALHHRNAYELLVATILSAQCTDQRVNSVTPALFKAYPDPRSLAGAPLPDIEAAIRVTGFYRNKAKSIQGASRIIVEQHAGHVPDTMEGLTQLPGVARKTANVVLGNVFDKNEGVVVDTHVSRLSQRIGLSTHGNPNKIEKDLMALFPRENWTQLAHLLIHHGRAVCSARKPKCDQCLLANGCPKIGV